jgi:hypothetical protein
MASHPFRSSRGVSPPDPDRAENALNAGPRHPTARIGGSFRTNSFAASGIIRGRIWPMRARVPACAPARRPVPEISADLDWKVWKRRRSVRRPGAGAETASHEHYRFVFEQTSDPEPAP